MYRNGVPAQALMDGYDIQNKAMLFNPLFDVNSLAMFKNEEYNRLRVISSKDALERQSQTYQVPTEFQQIDCIEMPSVTDSVFSKNSPSKTSPSSSFDMELPPLPPEMPHVSQPMPMMAPMMPNQLNVNRYCVLEVS